MLIGGPRAFPCQNFIKQGKDDFPLLWAGILRLINQDMVGRLIKFVAIPFSSLYRMDGARCV